MSGSETEDRDAVEPAEALDALRDLADLFTEVTAGQGTLRVRGDGTLAATGLTDALRAALRARKAEVLAALAAGYDAAAAAAWRLARWRDRDPACACCGGAHGRACFCDVCLDLDHACRALRVEVMGSGNGGAR